MNGNNNYKNNKKSMQVNINNISLNNNITFDNKNQNQSMHININNISMTKFISNSKKINEFENKYRLISRKKELYDSLEDEEII